MKKNISYLVLTIIAATFFVSCSKSETLQSYFVDHQEAPGFISQDFPLSMVKIDKSQLTEKQKEAYNSVEKLNFLGFKTSDENLETYQTETAKVKAILSDEKYNDLLDFNSKGDKVSVKYIGTDEVADEVVVYGSSKEKGFIIVRVLGHNMSPQKMITLVEALQNANFDESQLDDISNFFK
ncbi:DUF4252 domain-containing protein [Tamlana sp. I1]|uniref:DUF4252 domain-containing protein n=1 Tax=Tamlana sp. I1 TaxID=2762061 RepID=UPI001890A8EA|nr:DUF4252 domain-containing protein [Tamlana sp. I1]